MPELPEVETICRGLLRAVKGRMFEKVQVIDPRVIRGVSGAVFQRKLPGRRIVDITRRGKALIFDLQGLYLMVQPMMTGQVIAVPETQEVPLAKETKIVFGLSGQWRVFYNDQRLFGRLQILTDPGESAYIRDLGPEPLESGFTADILAARLKNRTLPVKTALMDGKCVAGIGNIYAAEILFRAGIDPRRSAGVLKPREIVRIHRAVRDVLGAAVAMGGTTVRNYRGGDGQEGKYQSVVQVYGRDGQPCRTCGRSIHRIIQSHRSTFYCPACQK